MTKIQEETFKLWLKVKRVLDDNKIVYWAIGGTAIGAFREGGFIKWDDDMDIAIKEEDIPLALTALEKNNLRTKDKFRKNMPHPFYKVYSDYVVHTPEGKENICIDIFPGFKKMAWTDTKWKWYKFKDKILYVKTMSPIAWPTETIGAKLFYSQFMLAKILLSWLPTKKMIKSQWALYEKIRLEDQDSNIRYVYYGQTYKLHNDISNLKQLKFENDVISVPVNFAAEMFDIFGNILKEPKKKINHNKK